MYWYSHKGRVCLLTVHCKIKLLPVSIEEWKIFFSYVFHSFILVNRKKCISNYEIQVLNFKASLSIRIDVNPDPDQAL
jgi:hypothetical protein